ncbi:DUF2169 family type VI secretion system accessory protein [Polyangium aurulentum]|uniref:DUF2169 family type VI secretion system accessory protein n=1 Tax=Polyangium aurulentum TaxID=2567896 RepID=UPI0010AE3426|nr:DUF2169 domain-containing protein [Polyangium aurulentum]UQA54608.1 DUF2169 domain-containing protein [Polyangium aurulentum]
MEILSLCPFRASALLWQAAPSAWSLTTVVKATFTLVNGGDATIAPAQDAVGEGGEAAASFLEDLVPLKARADVVVVGHAHAPGGEPIAELVARVDVGGQGKSLRIRGDRRWLRGANGLAPGEAEPFVRMPLTYERAARSADLPMGVALDVPPSEGELAVPNIEADPGHLPGYGPLPASSPARKRGAPEASIAWVDAVLRGEAFTAGPPPEGFDFSLFNVAPREQQLDLVKPSLPIVLEHLHPEHPFLSTRLPPQRPQAFRVDPKSGRVSEIVLRCDTLSIDADRGVVVVTFRGIADVAKGDEAAVGKIVIAAHSQGKRIRPERVDRFLRQGSSLEDDAGDAKHPLEVRHDTVMVAANKNGDTMALPEMSGARTIALPEPTPFASQPRRPAAGALPFRPGESGPGLPFQPPPPPSSESWGPSETGRIEKSAVFGPATPFQPPPPPPPETSPPGDTGKLEKGAVFGAATPFETSPPPPPDASTPGETGRLERSAVFGPATPFERTSAVPPEPTAPPRAPEPPLLPGVFPPPPPLMGKLLTEEEGASPPEPPKPPPLVGKLAAFEKPMDEPSTAEMPPKVIVAAPVADHETTAPLPSDAAGEVRPAKPAVPFTPSPGAAPAAGKPPVRVPAPLGPLLGKGPLGAPAKGSPSTPPPRPTASPAKPPTIAPPKPAVGPSVKPPSVVPRPLGATPLGARPTAPPAPKLPDIPTEVAASATAAASTAAAFGVPKSADASVASKPAEPPSPPPAALEDVVEPFDPTTAVPIDRCAAIAAELRHRRSERAAVLKANGLSESRWLAVEQHWTEAISRQTARGDRKLLAAYDVAYVAAQERLGLRVGLVDHARLQVASERGTTAEVLAELGLEPSDQMRLGRVWTQRLVGDPKRMAELAAALEAARKA